MNWPMMNGHAAIPVRSERQALDWSLVLASQGIEPWIQRDEEADRWLLVDVGSHNGTFALARYNTNGTLDTTFSGDGKVVAGGNAPA